jgi:hypothetical protein
MLEQDEKIGSVDSKLDLILKNFNEIFWLKIYKYKINYLIKFV